MKTKKKTPAEVLAIGFAALTNKQFSRLQAYVASGKKVLCGKQFSTWSKNGLG